MQKNIMLTIICCIILLPCTLTGCATGRHRTGVESDVLAYQREIDELEGTIRSYEAALGDTIRALADLGVRAGEMEATVDDVIELFRQYQYLTEQLLLNYNKLRSEVKTGAQDISSADTYNYTKIGYDGYRIFSLYKRYTHSAMAGYIAIVPEKENGRREQEKIWLS